MKIDLSKQNLYNCDVLDLATRINYIYGKNGTGKSTLTRLIRTQFSDTYDVRIFQNFESIVGESHRLDAVVLGEKNVDKQRKIEQNYEQIRTLNSAKNDIEKDITYQSNPEPDSLYVKSNLAGQDLAKVRKKLDKFYTDAAKAIKTRTNPQIAITTYNKNHFITDIPNARLLADSDRDALRETLKSEVKKAPQIIFPTFDIDQKLAEVNELLEKKVEPKKIIARIDRDAEKQQFAKEGLRMHKKGDVCAFCGNTISDAVFEELGSFFSADETEGLQKEIASCLNELQTLNDQVKIINIDPDSFYHEFAAEVSDIKSKWVDSVIRYIEIIDEMSKKLEEKKKHLFESMNAIEITDRPFKMSDFRSSYSAVSIKNDASDLDKLQKDARERLRLDAVYTEIIRGQYQKIQTDIQTAEGKVRLIDGQIEAKKKEIEGIKDQIKDINNNIKLRQKETVSEEKLAENINKTLAVYAGFELEHHKDSENKGYYRIKDKRTGETRSVDQLSTGEKNVIAFLYFMEKLNEVQEVKDDRKRIIVVDDPMNSNDEAMQDVIVAKLTDYIRSLKNNSNNTYSKNNTYNKNNTYPLNSTDTAVVLTHNVSFYLKMCGFNGLDYHETTVYHLEKEPGHPTKIKHITCKEQDVPSAYEGMWRQLKNSYNNPDSSADSMLNNMRRIVETYTLFNKESKYNFCNPVLGFMDLLNGNSHGFRDLDASSNGLSKNTLLKSLYTCFAVYKSGELHIKKYWPGIENLVK